MSEHAIFVYNAAKAADIAESYRVRSFCAAFDMPVDEAVGLETVDAPIDSEHEVTCPECVNLAMIERRIFDKRPKYPDDRLIEIALMTRLRYGSYAPGLTCSVRCGDRVGKVETMDYGAVLEYGDFDRSALVIPIGRRMERD